MGDQIINSKENLNCGDECDDLETELNSIKTTKQTGFKNIVKRIQLAARLLNVNQEETDSYHEDSKFNSYKSSSIRRRSKKLSSKKIKQRVLTISTLNDENNKNQFKINDKRKLFIKGEIKFLREEGKHELKPFITVDQDITQNDVNYVFKNVWELEAPKIVTFIISNKAKQTQWNNKKQIKNFQIGIAKAAISTNMLILTNGINCGITSYICSAIENALGSSKFKKIYNSENFPLVFGISYDDDLTYGPTLSNFDYTKSIVCLENLGCTDNNKFELNPRHSHYVIIKQREDNIQKPNNFVLQFIMMIIKGDNFSNTNQCSDVPLVSILIEGGPENILIILNLIRKQLPVIVLQGSGGLANIFAFAYCRIWTEFQDISTWDPDYIEDYIKPLLCQKISFQFKELKNNCTLGNILANQIIECVRLSRHDGRQYLTILDMHNYNSCNLTNLSEYFLNALLKSRRNLNSLTHEHVLKDFDLIMDWNCARVAKNLLFTQNSLNLTDLFKSKFLNILIRNNREEFVEIFLYNGFQLHKFLTPSQLSRLFRLIHEDDFFHSVCWEAALGQSSMDKQNKFFIENDLNWLIEVFTGLENFVNTEDLHLNALGLYTQDSLSAERKALTLISIWAVLHNRHQLAQVLWKYCDHPIHHALLISMIFDRLSWHVPDTNLKAELKQKSKKFADYANGVLDQCYNENITQAYNVLNESIKDWNYMTAVDIAANAQLKQFLVHPCCQKWLTNTFYGDIRLRDITWGFFTMPTSLKILFCSLFIFPMYIWVRFKNPDSNRGKNENDEDIDVYETMYNVQTCSNASTSATISFNNETSFGGQYINKAFEGASTSKSNSFVNFHRREVFVKKQPPLWKMVQMMWCSPITKFYTSQFFYMIFLMLISLTALSPNSSNFSIDIIVSVWALLIAISYIRQTYILFLTYSSVSIYPKIIEIILILSFVAIFSVTRIIANPLYSIYTQKILISLSLLYFYYRLISIYFPNSPTLGPLLHRFYLMITVDFFNYMRITAVIMISNAIVINALQYPNRELSLETIYSVLHEGILSLFYLPPKTVTIKTDADQNCLDCKSNYTTSNGTMVESESIIVYLFVYQYYIILRLIIVPLLFSIFAATASKWVTEIDSIWKFQRYHLVIDFVNRLAIPEPLSLFYYIYILFYYYLFKSFVRIFRLNIDNKKDTSNANSCSKNIISSEDCLYWKQLAADYLDNVRKKSEESQIIYKSWEYIQEISQEIEYEKKSLREIKRKISEIEKNQQESKSREKAKLSCSINEIDNVILSRLSPYPGTQIYRYPLPAKYVSWDIDFLVYEPVCYTIPKNQFESCLSVDEDIIKIKEDTLRGHNLIKEMPAFLWNGIDVDQKGILIDRRSWQLNDTVTQEETELAQSIQYKLEDNFLPLNPCGRTGIRGKGALQRWAVNHYCIIVIAQTLTSSTGNSSRQTKLLFQHTEQNRLKLIEQFVNNEEEIYKYFAKLFDFGNDQINIQNIADLRNSFALLFKEVPFEFKLIKSGYLDDQLNTDNAWKEANVFLLHLDQTPNHFARSVVRAELNSHFVWRQLTPHSTINNLPLVHQNLINLVSDYFVN